MKRFACLGVWVILLNAVVYAQSIPTAELFGGYSYAGADPFSTNQRSGFNGFEGALNINAGRWLTLVADFGGNYGTSRLPVAIPIPFPTCPPFCPPAATNFSVNTHIYTYLFGADFPYRKWQKFTPFAQILYGRAHVSGEARGTGQPSAFTETDTKGAIALGLGADYRISERLSWRVQADYLNTKFFRNTQDNYRVSTGIVLRFTHKKKTRTPVTP